MATAKRLCGPVAGTGSEATLYTAPSTGAVIRDLNVCNTTTTEQTFKLSIGADAAGTRLCHDLPVPAGSVFQRTGNIVLGNAETLRWTGPTTLTITASGVEL
jgi:hypothetical protein